MNHPAPPSIDCHAHIYTRAMPLAPDAWHHPPDDATDILFLETLRMAGVGYGVLAAASLFGDYNDYSLTATRAHSNLRTTVIVRPGIDRGILRDMNDAGAVGIRLQLLNKPMPDLAAAGYRGLLRDIADLGWHVELHDHLHRLPDLITAVENAGPAIVIDHFARPADPTDVNGRDFAAVLDAIARGRTWMKISAGFRLSSRDTATAVLAAVQGVAGQERLLWGSDWPFANFEGQVDYSGALAAYAALVPDPAVRTAIDRSGLAFYFPDRSA
ncbi:MAG: amidohydrolase [Sphingobium sp.]|nr:MAG: amidohydrolase [Sphingobium sp.]